MNQELDVMWSIATGKAIENNQPYTRYEFAKMVAAAEREKVATHWEQLHGFDKHAVAAFIRARGEKHEQFARH